MSANAENIKIDINAWIRNYPVDAFKNMRLNNLLLRMVDLADVYGGGGGTGNGSILVELTSANFIPMNGSTVPGTRYTDCPLTTLAGQDIALFWNEAQRFLIKDQGEWTDLPGGGFRVLIDEFDASTQNYHFYAYVK